MFPYFNNPLNADDTKRFDLLPIKDGPGVAPQSNRTIFVAPNQFLLIYPMGQECFKEFMEALRSNLGDSSFISPCDCKN